MPPRSSFLDRRIHVLGGSLPMPVALLITVTLVSSILAAQLRGFGAFSPLVPILVFAGQVWRLVTYVFVMRNPLGLIFGCLAIFWFGRDLLRIWGPVGLLARYVGVAAAAGAITCLMAFLSPQLQMVEFVGMWPATSALIIAWALVFPGRTMLFNFIVPLSGRNLIYATFASTLLYALLGGSIAVYIPDFVAQVVTLAAMRGNPFGGLWAKVKFEVAYRRWKHRSSNLREVPRPRSRDEDPRWYH
jgi:membrane associated rhomboid family serine protease